MMKTRRMSRIIVFALLVGMLCQLPVSAGDDQAIRDLVESLRSEIDPRSPLISTLERVADYVERYCRDNRMSQLQLATEAGNSLLRGAAREPDLDIARIVAQVQALQQQLVQREEKIVEDVPVCPVEQEPVPEEGCSIFVANPLAGVPPEGHFRIPNVGGTLFLIDSPTDPPEDIQVQTGNGPAFLLPPVTATPFQGGFLMQGILLEPFSSLEPQRIPITISAEIGGNQCNQTIFLTVSGNLPARSGGN